MTYDQVRAWIVAAKMPRPEGWEDMELEDFRASDLILTVEAWANTHHLPLAYIMAVDWPKSMPRNMLLWVNRESSCPGETAHSYAEWGPRKIDDKLKELVEKYGGPKGLEFTTVPDPANKGEE